MSANNPTIEVKIIEKKLSTLLEDQKRKDFFTEFSESLFKKLGNQTQIRSCKTLLAMYNGYPEEVTEKLNRYNIEFALNGKTQTVKLSEVLEFAKLAIACDTLQDTLTGSNVIAPQNVNPADWD